MTRKEGLSSQAYAPLAEGETYEPYVAPEETLPELTLKAALFGVLFGIVFGAANAYLGLRAGLTISTSIPVAVMTVAAFKLLQVAGVRGTILEANISQTVGSASSSLASGVIFTLPALFLWQLDPTLLQMTSLALCGGVLGVMFMIPLRRFLIQGEHGNLPYPEGTACAEVLVVSDIGGSRALYVFLGLGIGALVKLLTGWLRVVAGAVHFRVPLLKKAELGFDVSAALVGVGYILGPRIGAIMVGGGLLSWLVIIPLMAWWGEGRAIPLYPETVLTIAEMAPGQMWTRYVRYIGAGAVAAAGLITLVRSAPAIAESFRVGTEQLRRRLRGEDAEGSQVRTDRDHSLTFVAGGVVLVVLALGSLPFVFGVLETVPIRLVAALLATVAAFFFVTVSSRIVGLVGVTSNPTSGMTIATLLVTSSIFLAFGWTDDLGKAAAITVGCVVAIAASMAGDISQDLKTGFLLGATPKRQQTGELLGILTSATFVCLTVLLLDRAYGFGTAELPAPQATLMKVVIEGVLQQSLPWLLVGLGAAIAVVCELLRIPSLPFAVGIYLPVSTTFPVFIGGALRLLVERKADDEAVLAGRRERGILTGSGFVGGEGILGVLIAGAAVLQGKAPAGVGSSWAGSLEPWVATAAFVALAAVFAWLARRPSSA